ncbi:MAG: hypothetical protein ABH952_05580 [Candidatus Omnitrophota bacterium]
MKRLTLSSIRNLWLVFLIAMICALPGESCLGEQDSLCPARDEQEEGSAIIPPGRAMDFEGEGKDKKFNTTLFRVENLNLDEAKNKIKQLLTKDAGEEVSVKEFVVQRSGKKINFLIVKDTPQKIEEIGAVLKEWEKDYAPKTVDLDFYNVPLGRVLTTISQVMDLNIIGGEGLAEKITIHFKDVLAKDVLDIVLKSTAYTHVKEDEIIRIVPKTAVPFVSEIFELEYTTAARVKEAIMHLAGKDGEIKIFPKFSQGESSNVLVITDKAETVEIIRAVIEKLDKKLKQVMIEVNFCEVTLTNETKIGIDWVLKASLSGANSPTVFPFSQAGKRIIDPPGNLTASSTTLTVGNMSFAEFSAVLQALDSKIKLDVISSPRVATRDGEKAEIVIGDKVPIPLYERNRETGTLEITGYQSEDIGVVLRVIPVVNRDNTVTLEIHPEVSETTGFTGPNNERPIISTRQITTVFTIENGKTVVLGGLMKQNLINTFKIVPVLGRLPIFGRLFRYKDNSEQQTELLIFITPQILDETH